MRLDHFFRLCTIVGSLPNNIQNGQVADANPLMADLNWIVNQVNANAAPLAGVALLQGNNTWSGTQTFQAPVTFLSGAAATANTVSTVPNAGQVQSWAFNTLSSVASLAGTNSYRGIAPLQASVLSIGQIWTFITSSPNNGPVQFGINSIPSRPVFKDGLNNLSSGDIVAGKVHFLATNSTSYQLSNPGGNKGTFLPTISGSTSAGTTTYTIQTGNYVVADGRLRFQLRVEWTGATGTGNLQVGGFPFPSNGTTNINACMAVWVGFNLASATGYTAQMNPGGTIVNLYNYVSGTGVELTPVQNSGTIMMSGEYML